MGDRKNFEQKENKRSKKVLSAVKKVHGRGRYMGKKRDFEKCRGSLKRIQRKNECRS